MTDAHFPPHPEIKGTDDHDASFNRLQRTVSGIGIAEAHGAEKELDKFSDQAMGLKDKIRGFQNSTLYQEAIAVKDAIPDHLVSKSVAAVSKFAENSAFIMKGSTP
ncbi:hypothetical protein B0H14DRAFT_1684655 [Mycena olivaceomarginata]|nr:hypothetical protein B0H14DRAFT_1684655 [Mycena olivaceomarginata]